MTNFTCSPPYVQLSLLPEQPHKVCTKCGTEYPPTHEFWHRRKASQDGLQPICKKCAIEKTKKWQEENSEKTLEKSREWYRANRERALKRQKEYCQTHAEQKRAARRRYYAANREKIQERSRQQRSDNLEKVREKERIWRKITKGALPKLIGNGSQKIQKDGGRLT